MAEPKLIKYVVAVVLKRDPDSKEVLIVKRPLNDPDLGGHWGLPATSLQPGELPEVGAQRICKEKLNCEAKPVGFLGLMYQKRNSYDLFLMDIEMILNPKTTPDVKNAESSGTVYIEQEWSKNPNDLMPSAKLGSCCSSIYLTHLGLLNRQDWIDSLEGSDLVA